MTTEPTTTDLETTPESNRHQHEHEHEHQREHEDVTLIGTGPMGIALGEALLARGHGLTVWNRTPEKAEALRAKGARHARQIAEALSASGVAVLCLADYDAMYQAMAPAIEAGALRGRTLINLASGTPNEARAAAEWAAEHGADYLDGAIMVPPMLVGHPEAVFLYSGSQAPYDAHRRILTSMAGDPRHLGADPGLAVLHNVALLEMMYAIMNGWLHATALVGSAGVTAERFGELAFGWFMPTVLSPESFQEMAPDLDTANYPGDLGTLRMNLTALSHVVAASAEQGIHTEQPALMRRIAEQGVADGYGEASYQSLFEIFRRSTGSA